MNDAIEMANAYSMEWVDTILAVLWQSTGFAIAAAVVLGAWRGLSPRLRCWAWRLVAVKLLVMPFWMITIPVPPHVTSPLTQTLAIAPAPETQPTIRQIPTSTADHELQVPPAATITTSVASSSPLAWQSWLVAVWLSVLAVQVVRLIWQRVTLHRLLAAAQPPDDAIRKIVANACGQLRLGRPPDIRITHVEVSPFVCRMMRPVLLLPESLANSINASQLRQIVLHELAHLRRGDLLWCWLTHVARMVYWFHPVAYWIAFRESLERELACDEVAMSYSGATAADYACTLIEAASRLAGPAALRAITAARLDGGHSLGSLPWRSERGMQPSNGSIR
jgi:beta-lactamase regulating signal transducer with metallopeptidase domain